jgi:hypothetical protein
MPDPTPVQWFHRDPTGGTLYVKPSEGELGQASTNPHGEPLPEVGCTSGHTEDECTCARLDTTPGYSLEQLTTDLARARAETATELTREERAHILNAASEDASARGLYGMIALAVTKDALEDLGTAVGPGDSAKRWRRKRALARGDSLAAYWPEIAGRSDG